METIRELKEYVLDNPDDGVRALGIADNYLQLYDKIGNQLILPKEHSFAKPVVECFAGDPASYARWLKKVRDEMHKCGARMDLNSLFRKVEVRGIQRERRAREDAAVMTAVRNNLIINTPTERQRYHRRLVLEWGKRRYAVLDEARRSTKGGRLTLDEQSEVLARFWAAVDEEIAAGDLPPP